VSRHKLAHNANKSHSHMRTQGWARLWRLSPFCSPTPCPEPTPPLQHRSLLRVVQVASHSSIISYLHISLHTDTQLACITQHLTNPHIITQLHTASHAGGGPGESEAQARYEGVVKATLVVGPMTLVAQWKEVRVL
jgi:hypothetical protein